METRRQYSEEAERHMTEGGGRLVTKEKADITFSLGCWATVTLLTRPGCVRLLRSQGACAVTRHGRVHMRHCLGAFAVQGAEQVVNYCLTVSLIDIMK